MSAILKGKGLLNEALAACEMAAVYQKVPFRKDIIEKVLEVNSDVTRDCLSKC